MLSALVRPSAKKFSAHNKNSVLCARPCFNLQKLQKAAPARILEKTAQDVEDPEAPGAPTEM